MSLHLAGHQLEQIRELQELLVAPLRFPTADAWMDAVHHAGAALTGVGRSILVLPRGPDQVVVHSPTLEEGVLHGLDRSLVGTAPQMNRYDDPQLDRAMRRLAAARVDVWTQAIAERVSRIPLADMPRFYPEVVRPGRLEGMLMMGASLPEGRAMFGLFADRPGETALGDQAVPVFHLLLPAFKAACRAHALSAARWRRLGAGLDLLEEGVAVHRDGAEPYRNRALRRLLAADEQREELVGAITRCAERLLRSLRSRDLSTVLDRAATAVVTDANRYRIAACHLAGGTSGRPATVLVIVRPATPLLPDEVELRERYGFTARQAQVALLLARGHSNRAIAERLDISPHTARHHSQRVLEKVGATSRKALALHLLSARRMDPH